MLDIIPLPAFHDNYIWLLQQKDRKDCIIVDPGDAKVVINYLKKDELRLTHILVTHHHWDHTNGLRQLKQAYPSIKIIGSKKTQQTIGQIDTIVKTGDQVFIDTLNLTFNVQHIPGHTLDHVSYDTTTSSPSHTPLLFCGDTLFAGGCGRIFEGTAQQMLTSLDKLMALPDATNLYCAHEYTQHNLAFACIIEKDNPSLIKRCKQVAAMRKQSLPTLPATIAIEKATNPFLRCHLPSIADAMRTLTNQPLVDRLAVFTALRAYKDRHG